MLPLKKECLLIPITCCKYEEGLFLSELFIEVRGSFEKYKPKKETFCMLPEKFRTISLSIFLATVVGFCRACAPLRCAPLSFWLKRQTGRCAPPAYRTLRCFLFIPKNKLKYFMSGIRTGAAHVKGFPETKCYSSGSNSDPPH